MVDPRPALNALANLVTGKGYEDTSNYRNIAIQFFDIGNIHVVRDSLEKLLKGATVIGVCDNCPVTVYFLSSVRATGNSVLSPLTADGSQCCLSVVHEATRIATFFFSYYDRHVSGGGY